MSTQFLVPLHLQDLEFIKSDRIYVKDVSALEGLSTESIGQELRALSDRVLANGDDGVENEPPLLQNKNFDLCYNFVKKLASFTESTQVRVLQTFTTFVSHATKMVKASASQQLEEQDTEDLRNEFKAAVYFLVFAITTVSRLRAQVDQAVLKQKGTASASASSKTPWGKHIESALHALTKSISDETFGLWRMNLPEEEFANLYCRASIQVMENSLLCRAKTMKAEIYKCVGSVIKRVPSVRLPFVTSIVDLIFNHEHLTNALAELTEQLPQLYDYPNFPGDLIREISTISSGDPSKDVNGTRNISSFLTTLSNRSPSLIISNLTFVIGLLESESYQLRNAGVACIAAIVLWSFQHQGKDQGGEESDKESESDDESQATKEDDASRASDSESDSSSSAPAARKQNKDADGLPLSTLSRATRDQLLAVLEDRVHDVNSFARSHALKMWLLLCEHGAVPLAMIKKITAVAIGRLQDKAAVVRRHSITLLTLLLERNPFMGKLDREFHLKKRVELLATVQEKRAVMLTMAEKDMEIAEEADLMSENPVALPVPDEEEDAQLTRDLLALKRTVDFHTDALDFIQVFESGALKLMIQLLGSKSTTDVLEAMNFIRQAHKLKLSGADDGFKKLLPLIWKSDPAIREEVLNVFVSLFLRPGSEQRHAQPDELATKLLELLDECSVAEFTCVEKIVRELQQTAQMPLTVVSALWEFVDSAKFPAPVLTNALLLLGMVASADSRMLIAPERLFQVLLHGFGDAACSDDSSYRLFGAACRLLQFVKFDSLTKTKRLMIVPTDSLQEIVGRIQQVVALELVKPARGANCPSTSTWFDAIQQAIDAIFAVCERPEDVCAEVIKSLALRIFSGGSDVAVDSFELAHFLFVLGHVAIQCAIKVEQMAALIKRLRANGGHDKATAAGSDAPSTAEGGAGAEETAMEDELGVAAEVEAEEDAFVQDLIRHDLVGRNLLGVYGPLVVRLLHAACAGEEYETQVIECAVVALSKFMAVSDTFCEKHLQLLFTLLRESAVPTVRANIVVALGDLAFRFPNLIEPWTSHLYNRLRDVDVNVRKNTTVVLSHLILNDMVKVKGQISEIAISLVDGNTEIRNLVHLFFTELSKKGNNPIYNIFPDTVGQLSASELVSTKDFDQIMKFLLSFLTKDKHIESIVDKICQRYSTAHADQRRDFSFCLAHIQHTEKSLRYISQNRKLFKESLADPSIQDHFKLLVTRSRRHTTAAAMSSELKEVLDQLEQYFLNEAQSDETENADDENGVSPTPKNAGRASTKPKKAKAKPTPKKPTARKTRKGKRPAVEEDDEDDDE